MAEFTMTQASIVGQLALSKSAIHLSFELWTSQRLPEEQHSPRRRPATGPEPYRSAGDVVFCQAGGCGRTTTGRQSSDETEGLHDSGGGEGLTAGDWERARVKNNVANRQ